MSKLEYSAIGDQHYQDRPLRQKGLLPRMWHWLVGEPQHGRHDLRSLAGHGTLTMAIGRAWSFPLMIAFSLGALITLGARPLQHNLSLIQQGQLPDFIELAGLGVTLVFVIGMDLAMTVAATRIRDEAARDGGWRRAFGHVCILLLMGALEAWTFYTMVAMYEHPSSPREHIFIACRAVAGPLVAVCLATTNKRAVTRHDIEHRLRIQVGQGLLDRVEASVDTGQANLTQLWDLFSLLHRSSAAQREFDERVMTALMRIGSQGHDVSDQSGIHPEKGESAIAESDGHLMSPTAQGDVRLADKVEGVRSPRAESRAVPDLFVVDGGGDAVEAIKSAMPPASMPSPDPEDDDETGAALRVPSRAQRQREFLQRMDLRHAGTPIGRKGVFLQANHVVTLTDGRLSGDDARELIKHLGDEVRNGKAYVAPFWRVLADLHQRNLLNDDVRSWWESQVGFGHDRSDGLRQMDGNESA